jgi:hypothetical protein
MQLSKASTLNHKHHHKPISLAAFRYDPSQLARQCLADSHQDPIAAVALAARYAHGSRLRATVAAIGTAVLTSGAAS